MKHHELEGTSNSISNCNAFLCISERWMHNRFFGDFAGAQAYNWAQAFNERLEEILEQLPVRAIATTTTAEAVLEALQREMRNGRRLAEDSFRRHKAAHWQGEIAVYSYLQAVINLHLKRAETERR